MRAQEFCYWLQGAFEVGDLGKNGISWETAELIQRHLNLVFIHDIDPQAGGPEEQKKLNEAHSGGKSGPPEYKPGARC